MNQKSKKWVLKWSVDKYPPAQTNLPLLNYGTPKEPESSMWCASLSDPLGGKFQEGVCVMDYGCGCGRYFNFLTTKLKDFTYYGLEPKDTTEPSIRQCMRYFKNDSRAHFGFIGTQLEKKAAEKADVIISGSVFTHLPWTQFERICDTLLPTVKRGALFSFSCYIAPKYTIEEKGPIIYNRHCCWRAFYTNALLQQYAQNRNVSITLKESHPRDSEGQQYEPTHTHKIFLMERVIKVL